MLTLPNILTLSRIFAVPLLLWLLWWPRWEFGYGLAFGLYCLMGITDYFDGYLARASGTVSKLGIFLDPIADKIMVAAVILILVDNRDIQGLHVIAALVILLREIMVSGLREFLAGLKVSVPVSKLAKWKTTLQLVSLGSLILGGALPNWHSPDWVVNVMAPVHSGLNDSLPHYVGVVSLWGAAILTLVTGWDYLRAGIRHMD
ncbi:MAG TPA: CDP-diacylglycerol--glycerol-3-phosphate 3-phosphatidyltransferase [Planctomycetaceae bacterium]|nr:CDP-diacylglycerol--glycerol-3-phosphate 3-phosphatidyltransferase [Planctomycetaceae bacterium]